MMRNSFVAAVAAMACVTVGVHAWAGAPPVGSEDYLVMHPHKKWVESQYSSSGTFCCLESDGRPVEAKMVGDHWEVFITAEKFPGSPPGWMPVPSDAVLHTGNPVGENVAWVLYGHLYCFAPADLY